MISNSPCVLLSLSNVQATRSTLVWQPSSCCNSLAQLARFGCSAALFMLSLQYTTIIVCVVIATVIAQSHT